MDKHRRKSNWSTNELEALAQGVSANIKTIKGKFSPGLTKSHKMQCWKEITERVNFFNVSETNRDINDCKKKWHDISCATKKKEASRRKEMRVTGGVPAPPDDLKAWERLIAGTLSTSSVEGVEGGVDTLECVIATPVQTSDPNETSSSCFELMDKDNVSISVVSADADSKFPQNLPESVSMMEGASASTQSFTSSESSSSTTPRPVKRKKHQSSGCKAETTRDIREEFVEMEKEKERRLQEYREKKLGLIQNMMDQQNEMIQLQRRSTEALESLVVKFPGHLVSPMSPFSVSPVIKFS
nr:uncharacterized protein LOC105322890 [Crassostrea gigas]